MIQLSFQEKWHAKGSMYDLHDLHDFHYSTCEAKLIKALQVNAKNAPQDRGAPLHALLIDVNSPNYRPRPNT